MTPRMIAKHAYHGSKATIRYGRHTRSGKISHCSEDGTQLFMWIYCGNGYDLTKNALPVPAHRVIKIRHGMHSTAPDYVKRAHVGGVW